MKRIYFFAVLVLSVAFLSCNKTAGEGGTSSITGKLWVIDQNGAGEVVAQYPGADLDVYIIYGDEDLTYDENFKTSLDGSFRFNNLTQGTYTLFAYSKCATCPSGETAIQTTVEITENKQLLNIEDIVIFD